MRDEGGPRGPGTALEGPFGSFFVSFFLMVCLYRKRGGVGKGTLLRGKGTNRLMTDSVDFFGAVLFSTPPTEVVSDNHTVWSLSQVLAPGNCDKPKQNTTPCVGGRTNAALYAASLLTILCEKELPAGRSR